MTPARRRSRRVDAPGSPGAPPGAPRGRVRRAPLAPAPAPASGRRDGEATRRAARRRPAAVLIAAIAAGATALAAGAEVPLEPVGRVERLPARPSPHWVFLGDPLLRRAALLDLDGERLLGMVSFGFGVPVALPARTRPELYVPETHYSRGSRGTRTDVVTIYGRSTLAPLAEVEIPPKRAIYAFAMGSAALSDDDRFLAVFNLTPGTSLTVVDLERRALAGEIETPGCSLVYPAGPRRFFSLCMDGAVLVLDLDEAGGLLRRTRSRPFFDPERDPITEKGVRDGSRWLFTSFEGFVHEVDLSGPEPAFGAPWSLFSDEQRRDSWRIGGTRHLALHRGLRRLYALVHRGGPDTHKEPGRDVFVYDLDRRERVDHFEVGPPGLTYMGIPVGPGEGSGRLLRWLFETVLRWLPLGVNEIAVTQDEKPLLLTAAEYSGAVAVYDARTGAFLRRVQSGNASSVGLSAPFGGAEGAP